MSVKMFEIFNYDLLVSFIWLDVEKMPTVYDLQCINIKINHFKISLIEIPTSDFLINNFVVISFLKRLSYI